MKKRRIKEVYLEPETTLPGLGIRAASWVAVLMVGGDRKLIPFAKPEECTTDTAKSLARARLLF